MSGANRGSRRHGRDVGGEGNQKPGGRGSRARRRDEDRDRGPGRNHFGDDFAGRIEQAARRPQHDPTDGAVADLDLPVAVGIAGDRLPDEPAQPGGAHLADVLVDGMRGRSSLWYRVRVNLIHVPEADRPTQGPLEVDYDPWAGYEWPDRAGQLERAPRKRKTAAAPPDDDPAG